MIISRAVQVAGQAHPAFGIASTVRGGPVGMSGAIASQTAVSGRLYMYRAVTTMDYLITELGLFINVGQAATNFRAGIYSEKDDKPYLLVSEFAAAQATTSSSTFVSAAVSAPVRKGVPFYVATLFDNSTVTFAGYTSTNSGQSIGFINSATSNAYINGIYRAYAFGALPADESGSTFNVTSSLPPLTLWK
jgi:hypothetical protein